MYYPYLRGKQNELIALRDLAEEISNGEITPILEPVKENTATLQKCLSELKSKDAPFIIISNPKHGELKTNNLTLIDVIIPNLRPYDKFQVGYIIDKDSELSSIRSDLVELKNAGFPIALIHYGYPDGSAVAEMLNLRDIDIQTHIFIDEYCGKRYIRNFDEDVSRVLIRDGFRKSKNADYTGDEPFSELHLTYEEDGYAGFGDFLIVGDEFSESGGPAYAVAIHITYLRSDDEINIRHYVSDRRDSPVDPAGKFQEALSKLIDDVDEEDSVILETDAINELKDLFNDGHFPGLGYLKRLSMEHHIELILDYLRR